MRASLLLASPLLASFACGGEPARPAGPPPVAPAPVAAAAAPPSSAAPAPAAAGDSGAPPAATGPARLAFKPVALPGATAPASIDYIAYEPAHARVWVPVGDTASADVYDLSGGAFVRVDGFKSVERESGGKKRKMGPSSVAVGEGVVYVGDRGSSEVCAVDAETLKLGQCIKLASSPDGLAYVAATKELWATTPRDGTLTVLDASKAGTLSPKATVKLDGRPEGYAVDPSRGRFLTNLEDKDRTVAVDVKARTTKAIWKPECGSDGPRGIAADVGRGFVYVACTDHVVVLDGAHDGAPLGKLDVGAGIDNIDWLEPQRLLYVAAGKAGKLIIARVDNKGQPTVVAAGDSTAGARNGVADPSGNAYVVDPQNARLLVFAYSP